MPRDPEIDDHERRLVTLEMRAMEQEKLLDELSSVLHAQQRTIDRLEAELRALRLDDDDEDDAG